MAAPVLQSSSTYSNATDQASHEANAPTGITEGDLLIAAVSARYNGGSYTVTPPSGWDSIVKVEDGSGTASFCEVFKKVAGASEPATYTFSFSPNDRCGIGIARIDGHNAVTPINVFGSQSNALSTTCTAPSVTTTEDECLMLFIGHVYQETTFSTPTGYTEQWDFITGTTTGAISQALAYDTQTTAGASGTVTSTTNNRQSAGILIAIAPEATPSSTTPDPSSFTATTTFTTLDVQTDVTLNLPTLTTPTTIYATGTAPLIENPGTGPVAIDATVVAELLATSTTFSSTPSIQLDWVFSPPATTEIPRYDVSSTSLQRRLSSHFIRTTRADNLYVLTDNSITTVRPTDESTIANIYHGGHVYTLTPEERAILVAAGYMEE